MRLEHRSEPVLSRPEFRRRVLSYVAMAVLVLGSSLFAGTAGLHCLEGTSWLDAMLNSAMLLGGMGPTTIPTQPGAKIFSTFFALYAGLVFVVVSGLIVTPWAHRILHKLHAEKEQES